MAIMGDAGQAGSELNRLKESLTKEGIDSVIMPGDNLYKGTYSSVWDSWKTAGFKFDVVAIGNHHDGYANEVQYFAMPGEYYSIQKNGARFLVLNSDNTKNIAAQFQWLEEQITKATEELVFLVYHHPTFTITGDHSWPEKKDFQLRMRQFLKTYGNRITALLLGHDHITSFIDFGTIPTVVAGSGRSARFAQPVSYNEDGFQIQTQFLAPKTQHWVLLEINEEATEALVHIVRVQDQKRICTSRLSKGNFHFEGSCR